MGRLAARFDAFADRYPFVRAVLDVQKRYTDLQGGVVASAVTLTLFLSLFPVLLVATAVVGFIAADGKDVAGAVVDALGLSDEAARTVTDGVAAASRSRRAASIIGLLGLTWTALGVATAVKSAVDRPWQAKGGGVRDRALSFVWLVGAGVMIASLLTLTGLLVSVLPGWAASAAALVTVVGHVALFWWTFHLLGSVDVGWRRLLPGAIVAGLGFELLTLLGAFVVPRMVASSSALYGSIGVVFAVIAWLFMFGRLLVYACIINVVLYERSQGTVTVEVEVPKVEGQVPLTGTRGGVVDEVEDGTVTSL